MEILQPAPGRTVIDATFGRGGHSRALLARGARVIALDVDPEAEVAAKTLASEVGRIGFVFTERILVSWRRSWKKRDQWMGCCWIWGFLRLR